MRESRGQERERSRESAALKSEVGAEEQRIGRYLPICYIDVCYLFTFRPVDGSEVGGENGAERRPPPGIQAQRPRTRTARTTRQINGAISVQWLGRFWRKVSLCGSRPRPTSNRPHRCYELKTTVITMVSVSQWTGIRSTC